MNCTRLVSRSSAADERPHEQRLGDAGHALEQHVAAAQQRDDQAADGGVLPDDRLGDLGAHGAEGGAQLLGRLGARGGGCASRPTEGLWSLTVR